MSRLRRSYESGHRPKYLVFVDDTAELDRALYYGARRAARTGARIVLLTVLPPEDFIHWRGVADMMKEEAIAAAEALLDKAQARVKQIAPVEPERVIREGVPTDEILRLIDQDEDIASLVLASATGKEGPGPLVSNFAKNASSFPIPVTLVPGSLTDAEIDALA